MLALLAGAALAAQSVAPQTSADFTNVTAAPGRWSYAPLPGGSEAMFFDSSGAARLSIRCNRPLRWVSISRVGAAPAASISLWTSSAVRNLLARYDPATQRVTAEVAASDPLLDAIAFSRGRIAVSMPGFVPLVVPVWAEPARAIEDCRS